MIKYVQKQSDIIETIITNNYYLISIIYRYRNYGLLIVHAVVLSLDRVSGNDHTPIYVTTRFLFDLFVITRLQAAALSACDNACPCYY